MQRPNILLIMTDQQRGDCLGADGHPCLLTPNLDELCLNGMRFRRAYSTCPVCIPARRSLLSGQFPATHGMLNYLDQQEWQPSATLPQMLRDAGYQTQLVGRSMHQYPDRKRFGYDEMITNADYGPWLERLIGVDTGHDAARKGSPKFSSGIMHNDWTARPWPYPEDWHSVNWTMSQARRFLERRDPSCPFFLTVSVSPPHPPLTPPAFYFERYLRMDLPEPTIGDWAQAPEGVFAVNSARVRLEGEVRRSCLAGYFGSINHVDDQIRRIVYKLNGIPGFDPDNTLIVFTSDHGEMLGDHYLFRKQRPYEGAARIPFIIKLPKSEKAAPRGRVSDVPVSLEDILPTLLDAAGVGIPSGVDGQSLLPLLRGEKFVSRRGEIHVEIGGGDDPFHALTDGRNKYIWFSRTGREQLFDLVHDPRELRDLSQSCGKEVADWRDRLIRVLDGRPEGFVEGGRLTAGRKHSELCPR